MQFRTWSASGQAWQTLSSSAAEPTAPAIKTLNDPPFVDQRTFNYEIKGQDGRRFWGEIKSGDRTEPFAASISLDNKYAYGADTDGNFHFTILSADEMELCYTQSADVPSNQIVATCFPIKRTSK
jgi:hypothetical protein